MILPSASEQTCYCVALDDREVEMTAFISPPEDIFRKEQRKEFKNMLREESKPAVLLRYLHVGDTEDENSSDDNNKTDHDPSVPLSSRLDGTRPWHL